jgi:hypothetical protein
VPQLTGYRFGRAPVLQGERGKDAQAVNLALVPFVRLAEHLEGLPVGRTVDGQVQRHLADRAFRGLAGPRFG